MGFFLGLVMLIGSYLMLGPIMMGIYTTYYKKDNSNKNQMRAFWLVLLAIYIIIWIICGCLLTKHIGWLITGAIIGLICAIVTFNKNKEQTLISIDKQEPIIEDRLQGTDLLFSEIINKIKENGIDYIADDNPIPYICQIMQFFDKNHVEWAIKEFNPNLNIEFECAYDDGDGVKMMFTPLDYAACYGTSDMFELFLNKNCKSLNYYQLCLFIMMKNDYNSLKKLLTARKFNINQPLTENTKIMDQEDLNNYKCTLLDFAVECGVHYKIIELLKEYGAKNGFELNGNTNIEFDDVPTRIKNLYAGKVEKFSLADLASYCINLVSFKRKLPYEIYQSVLDKYGEYQTKKELHEYNLQEFVMKMMLIQDEFSVIIGQPINTDGTI